MGKKKLPKFFCLLSKKFILELKNIKMIFKLEEQIVYLTQVINDFQHEKNSVTFKLLSVCMKDFNNKFLLRRMCDLRSRQNDTINAL